MPFFVGKITHPIRPGRTPAYEVAGVIVGIFGPDQRLSRSGNFGGCSSRLLAQRSRFSMIFWWLGRIGFGALGSSESARGNLIFSLMGRSPLCEIMTRPETGINHNLLLLLAYFTKKTYFPQLVEPE